MARVHRTHTGAVFTGGDSEGVVEVALELAHAAAGVTRELGERQGSTGGVHGAACEDNAVGGHGVTLGRWFAGLTPVRAMHRLEGDLSRSCQPQGEWSMVGRAPGGQTVDDEAYRQPPHAEDGRGEAHDQPPHHKRGQSCWRGCFVGMHDGEVFNGADDDGSGTVAILEIAEAFKAAQEKGQGPKRSVIFLHVTGEEKGLLGSAYYADNPIFPLENTVNNLNIDMIGHVDPDHENDRDYVYAIGSEKLSSHLKIISEYANITYMGMNLDYRYDDPADKNRFYYRSDHYNFAKKGIPIIFYFNGTHADYHRPSDTVDKIEFDVMARRAQLVFHTAWILANRDDRTPVDRTDDMDYNR